MLQVALIQDTVKDFSACIRHHLLLLAIAREPQAWAARALRAPHQPRPSPYSVCCSCLSPRTSYTLSPEAPRPLSGLCFWWVSHYLVLFWSSTSVFEPFVPRSWTFWPGNREQESVLRTFPVKQSGSREENTGLGEVCSKTCYLWSGKRPEGKKNTDGERTERKKEKRREERHTYVVRAD